VVFRGGPPILAFLAFQQTSFVPKGVLAESIIGLIMAIICLYALVTFIMACDPLIGAKATAMKEMMQSLPTIASLLGKDKKE
jgi:hypothetical protein